MPEKNRTKAVGNIRDYAAINELICLSNMENINALLINDRIIRKDRHTADDHTGQGRKKEIAQMTYTNMWYSRISVLHIPIIEGCINPSACGPGPGCPSRLKPWIVKNFLT
jgi:hypothetical protein